MPELPQIVRERLEVAKTLAGHPDPDVLAAFSERLLPASERDVVLEHLARCGECREIVALALPETEAVPVPPAHGRENNPLRWGWLRGAGLRWAVVAAGIVVVASVGVVELQRNQLGKSTVQSKLEPKSEIGNEALAPPSAPAAGAVDADKQSVPKQVPADQPASELHAEQNISLNGRNVQPLQMSKSDAPANQIHSAITLPEANASSGNQSSRRNFTALQKFSPPAKSWTAPAGQAFDAGDRNATGALTDSLKPAAPATVGVNTGGPVQSRQDVNHPASQPADNSAAQSLEVQTQAQNVLPAVMAPAQTQVQENQTQAQQNQTLQTQTLQNSTEEAQEKDQEISDLPKQQGGRTSTGLQDLARANAAALGASPSRTRLPLWSVTSIGKLRRSFDGGKTWQDVNVGDSSMAAAMFAKSADTQVAKVKTKDTDASKEEAKKKADQDTLDAKAYAAKNAPIRDEHPVIFRAVSALSSEVWAGGVAGALYHSEDSGIHWIRVVPSSTGTMLTSDIVTVEVPSPKYVKLATSNSEVWTTLDDGHTWQKQ